MTHFIINIFIKNKKEADTADLHSGLGKLGGITGIILNTLLFIAKLIAGILSGSVSVIADGINNLSDSASSVLTYLGFRLAQQPADKDHPFGHARYEYIAGLGVAMVIFYIGENLATTSFGKILHPVPVLFSYVTISVLALSSLIKLWMMFFFKKLGKLTDSPVLFAAATDSRNDVIVSLAVLSGIISEHIFKVRIDGYIGLAAALFIIYSAIMTAADTISPLLGKSTDKKLTEKISRLVLSNEKVLGIHDLLVHDYGPGKYYASVHVELSSEESPLECHDIIDGIEWEVFEKLNVHLVIHYDPVVINDSERDEMYNNILGIIEKIDSSLSIHDFRPVRGSTGTKLVFDLAVPYSMMCRCGEIKALIDEEILKSGKNYTTVIRFDGIDTNGE